MWPLATRLQYQGLRTAGKPRIPYFERLAARDHPKRGLNTGLMAESQSNFEVVSAQPVVPSDHDDEVEPAGHSL